jgi:hypothetical protein
MYTLLCLLIHIVLHTPELLWPLGIDWLLIGTKHNNVRLLLIRRESTVGHTM